MENVNLGGRPRKFETAEELENEINKYFEEFYKVESFDDLKRKPTIAGLALRLGFASRQSIYDYAEEGKFSYVVKRAVLAIEDFHESALSGNNVTGHVFWLKNHGWKDKSEVDNTLNIKSALVGFGDGNGESNDTE